MDQNLIIVSFVVVVAIIIAALSIAANLQIQQIKVLPAKQIILDQETQKVVDDLKQIDNVLNYLETK